MLENTENQKWTIQKNWHHRVHKTKTSKTRNWSHFKPHFIRGHPLSKFFPFYIKLEWAEISAMAT
jgi:hypothetical protein